MLTNLAQAFWICIMLLSWADLTTTERDIPVKEYIDGEEINEPMSPKEIMEILELSRPPCDVPECSLMDCDGAGPPPFCPRNVTLCRSGCACIRYCKDQEHALYCYQTKYCRTPRRFSPDIFTTTQMMFKK